MLAAHPVLGLRGEPLDRRAAEPADEVEVVRGEVLDDADVADAVGERADALGGDQEDLAELARPGRGGAARAAPGCSARRSRRRRGRPAASQSGDDLAALVDGRGERLLDEQVARRPRRASRTAARCSSVGTATTAKSGAPAASSVGDRRVDERRVGDGAVAVPAGVHGARERDAAACSAAAARGGGPSCRGPGRRRAGPVGRWSRP